MPDALAPLRDHLIRALEWTEAQAGFDKAIAGIPAARRGERPAGFDHSPWELVEHLRLAQKDLLDFCVNTNYVHAMTWPDDYWPGAQAPSEAEWQASLADFTADRSRLQEMIRNESLDLFSLVPAGKDRQTYLRAILLVIDHNAYHVGQLVAVRQALGIWR